MASSRIIDRGFSYRPSRRFLRALPPRIALIAALVLCALPVYASCSGPQSLQAAAKVHPTASSYAQLANWFGEHRQFACAAQALHSALHLDPASTQLNYLLGLASFESHNFTAAIPALRRVIAQAPSAPRPRLLLASVYMYLQQWKNAAPQWQAALTADPGNSMALHGLSHCFVQLGNNSAEIKLLSHATLDPALTLDLAVAYTGAGRYHKALATLRTTLLHSSAPPASTAPLQAMLAWVLLDDRQPAAALPVARQAFAAAPTLPAAQIALGRALVETGHAPSAIKVLAPAQKQDPHNLEIHIDLARAYADAGHPNIARHERHLCLQLVAEADTAAIPGMEEKEAAPAQ